MCFVSWIMDKSERLWYLLIGWINLEGELGALSVHYTIISSISSMHHSNGNFISSLRPFYFVKFGIFCKPTFWKRVPLSTVQCIFFFVGEMTIYRLILGLDKVSCRLAKKIRDITSWKLHCFLFFITIQICRVTWLSCYKVDSFSGHGLWISWTFDLYIGQKRSK